MPIQTRNSKVTTLVEGIRIARNASRPKRYGRDDWMDLFAADCALVFTKMPTAVNAT